MKLTITQAQNGYVLEIFKEQDELDHQGQSQYDFMAYQDSKESDYGDDVCNDALISMFGDIKELIGESYSKYRKHNTVITCRCEIEKEEKAQCVRCQKEFTSSDHPPICSDDCFIDYYGSCPKCKKWIAEYGVGKTHKCETKEKP